MTDKMDVHIRRPWWRRRGAVLGLGGGAVAAIILALLVGAVGSPMRSMKVPASSVTTAKVERGVFHDSTTLQGTVAPRDTVYLDALEGGQVEKTLVQAGDRVVTGQPLVKFRNTQLELDVLDRVGRLIESITQLQSYEKQLEKDRADNTKALNLIDYNIVRLRQMLNRRDPLTALGYVPKEQSEQLRDELTYNETIRPVQRETIRRQDELRIAQLPRIHAELASLQQSLVITRGKLDDLIVRAPASGRLTAMDLKTGENRNRGERLGEITLDTGFKITASVDEYYLARVKVGQTGSVDFDGRDYPLKVSRVYPQVKNGTFSVDLDFQHAPPAALLTPGQAALGKLSLGADRPALILPAGAFLERTGGAWAFVVDADGHRATRRPIKTGRRTADQVEVLSGLNVGDRVITSDYSVFGTMDRVNLTK